MKSKNVLNSQLQVQNKYFRYLCEVDKNFKANKEKGKKS